jgi:uncharacterized protein YjaG (DUF416 family)
VLHYDESEIVRRLSTASTKARALFAVSSAERLFPLFELYASRTDQGSAAQLRAALDAAWEAVDSEGPSTELSHWQEVAEDLVPDEDDEDWVDESAYGQNGAAAVAYALRTRLTDEPQEAGWAARQLYEAADYAAQQQLKDLDINDPRTEHALLSSPVVQEALSGVRDALALIDSDSTMTRQDTDRLKHQSKDAGERLAQLALQ